MTHVLPEECVNASNSCGNGFEWDLLQGLFIMFV